MREVTLEKKYLTRDKIIGKQVIDSKAKVMGTVKDLSFDLVAKDFSLIIKAEADKEITVDSKNVKVVGDVILLAVAAETFETPDPSATPATPATPEESPSASPPAKPSPPRTLGLCSGCGFQNESSSKFCIKCGSKL
jgi:sporulation protein YlmC with PRC-barrel domain